MEYKTLPDYPNYRVYENGEVRSTTASRGIRSHPRLVKPYCPATGRGYPQIGLRDINGIAHSRLLLHRIIALVWVPNPENKPCVNHKDGNKMNFHPSNLEWVTNLENAQHAAMNGLRPSGETHHEARITEADVIRIRYRAARGESQAAMGREYGITQQAIYRIVKRLNWKHVP